MSDASIVISSQLALPTLQNECDDGTMIRIMDPRPPKCHIPKKSNILLLVWLGGLIPLSPPLLLPGPPSTQSLSLTHPLNKFAR